MALKNVLIHLDSSARSNSRLGLACSLARRWGAHLTGVFIVDLPTPEFFYAGAVPYMAVPPEELLDRIRAEAIAGSDPVQAQFRERLRTEDLQGEWRLAEGNLPATLALHARYADLTIVGQPAPNDRREATASNAAIVTTVMSSGRPVLAVPYAGEFSAVGERVLVAWNASRESARAVNDALPLLEQAKMVTVLAVNPRHGIGGQGDVPAADITLHLARHGVRAEAAHTVATDIADGETLLSYAADISADLIVAGAYGHSRARELVFGGVTRTLLNEMTVPVFLSH
ncbi:MAG: universal stress protein [Acetobacteraceae bacterium]|nr:universal stress protein [Acetobacteraceae bacterium]